MARRIVSVSGVLGGKPVLEGTRISVELLLELAGAGIANETVLRNYPELAAEDLAAAFAYGASAVRAERVIDVPLQA